ncbi:NAC domain-containing protein [Actinidia chinensis var. chinensis]|uniref:NAC domain-containing protein n=1 Tax=Actinidia chinensis var. chinensis TaxID=1590841 RepID=A0A2R6Q7B9_ACTCC|nr:NAC domain-containing protein [Actinidia chinensis var. chinensis]
MDEKLSQTQISISAPSVFPGFRFSPTDGELISYYLKKKLEGSEKCVEVISVVEICKYEPWDLPAKSVVQSENEWFFFSPRGRTHPHGLQRKRATESGYWKVTGKERNVKSGSNLLGTKRTLVFHKGRAPKGERTEWIMHEYCMSGMSQDSLVVCRLRKNTEFRLNDSPRQGSSSLRPLSTKDSINFTLSEVAVEQLGLLEGAKAVESCLKECSSSHNSHSVEQQIDSESESNLKLAIELSQLCSSSCQGFDDEECYAEILKDDIVDLGKTLLPPTPDLLPMVPEKTEDEKCCQQPEQAIPSHVLPLQGKANRRIRLRWLKYHHKFHFKPVEVRARNNSSFVKEFVRPNSDQPPNYILGLLSSQRVNRRSVFVVLVVLTLLVLFVSMLGVP